MAEPGLVLDASAVIALFRREPFATPVTEALRLGPARMTTVNAAETVDVLVRVYGWHADDVVTRVEQLLTTVVEPVPASLDLATKAGEIRARLYDRRTSRLSIADCFVLAISGPGDRVATADGVLAAVARDEGYEVVPLG